MFMDCKYGARSFTEMLCGNLSWKMQLSGRKKENVCGLKLKTSHFIGAGISGYGKISAVQTGILLASKSISH